MSSKTVHFEREVKLGADLDVPLPDLRRLVSTVRLPEQQLSASYFDTPTMRLWARRITLRHRTGEGPDEGLWTLKLPTDESDGSAMCGRTEFSWSGRKGLIPPEATDLLRGIVRHAELGQLVDLTTTRQRLALRVMGGKALAELDDDTVVVSGGPKDGLRFRQLELELAEEGDCVDMINAVIGELQRAGARLEDDPKLAKALGLSAGSNALKGAKVGRQSSLGDVVRSSITNALDRLLDHDYRLRLDPANPSEHDVHQARVATRRLRSDLKTLRPLLDPVWLEHSRDELQWLGAVLGHVRDADVLSSLFDTDPAAQADTTGQGELVAKLREQRLSACQALADALAGNRYLRLLERLDAAAKLPPFVDQTTRGKHHYGTPDQAASRALPRLVGKPWRSLARKVRKAGRHPTDQELHKIRIGAKQLRYAAELAAPVVGKAARRTATAAEKLQTVLGDHHDAVGAEAWLRVAANRDGSGASFSAGQLVVVQARRQRELRGRWRRSWEKLSQKNHPRWLAK